MSTAAVAFATPSHVWNVQLFGIPFASRPFSKLELRIMFVGEDCESDFAGFAGNISQADARRTKRTKTVFVALTDCHDNMFLDDSPLFMLFINYLVILRYNQTSVHSPSNREDDRTTS